LRKSYLPPRFPGTAGSGLYPRRGQALGWISTPAAWRRPAWELVHGVATSFRSSLDQRRVTIVSIFGCTCRRSAPPVPVRANWDFYIPISFLKSPPLRLETPNILILAKSSYTTVSFFPPQFPGTAGSGLYPRRGRLLVGYPLPPRGGGLQGSFPARGREESYSL